MLGILDRAARAWLTYHHGAGVDEQYQFYRCLGCHRVVTWRQIREGGCTCGTSRVAPAGLSLGERARLLFLPWAM